MILNRKTVEKMGTTMSDHSSSKPSNFALRQMEKMGWKEGMGLGKNADGISKHLVIIKREENAGIGSESLPSNEMPNNWWQNAFSSSLQAFTSSLKTKKSNKKKSKNSKKSKQIEVVTAEEPPSFEELFAATGGARLGMRARAKQAGKLKRTEIESITIKDELLVSDLKDSTLEEPKRKKKKNVHTESNKNSKDTL
jgi:Pin2-interacting protein X1